MTAISNPLTRGSIVIVLSVFALGIGLSGSAGAATGDAGTSAFCARLTDLKTKVSSGLDSKTQKWITARKTRDLRVDQVRDKWVSNVDKNRENWDQQRMENIKKLEENAKTDTGKAAVKTYSTIVKNAVATRRNAHDQSRTTFIAGIDNIISAHRTSLDTHLSTFTAEVDAAFSTAQENCGNGTAASDVRSTLIEELTAARKEFQAGRKGDSTIGSQIQQLNLARIASNKVADQTFQKTIKEARAVLKTAIDKP